MLDPMTAVSLASAIVQFVDFSSKVVRKTREMSNSARATGSQFHSAEIITKDLMRLSQIMKDRLCIASENASPSEEDKALEEVCNECILLSEKMLKRLSNFKVQDGDKTWRVALRAVRAVWSAKELDEMSTQLAAFRDQIELRVFVGFR